MPITQVTTDTTSQSAPPVALSKDDLVAALTESFQQAGIKAPAPQKSTDQTVSKFQETFNKYATHKESDPALVEAIGDLFNAFKADVQKDIESTKSGAVNDAARDSVTREIKSAVLKLGGDNAGVRSYSGAITQTVLDALATSPEYAAARREFERTGVFDPAIIEKAAAKEVELLAPKQINTRAAGGIADGANTREQSALSKGASEDEAGPGDITPRDDKEEDFLNAAAGVFQKSGKPVRDEKNPRKYSKEATEFLATKLRKFREGKDKSRDKRAAR